MASIPILLDKIISSQFADISRSDAKGMIRNGRVTVDGEAVKNPDIKIGPEKAEVRV